MDRYRQSQRSVIPPFLADPRAKALVILREPDVNRSFVLLDALPKEVPLLSREPIFLAYRTNILLIRRLSPFDLLLYFRVANGCVFIPFLFVELYVLEIVT